VFVAILSAELTKTHSFRLFFLAILPTGIEHICWHLTKILKLTTAIKYRSTGSPIPFTTTSSGNAANKTVLVSLTASDSEKAFVIEPSSTICSFVKVASCKKNKSKWNELFG